MWHKNVKWARMESVPLESGDTVECGNMSQWKSDTPVLKSLNNLTFINVNMRNVKGLDLGKQDGRQSLVLKTEIDPKDGQKWLIFEKNIRCKGCLIMQKDIIKPVLLTPEQEEVKRFEMAMEGLFFDHGGKGPVIQRIADKYNLQPKTAEIQ